MIDIGFQLNYTTRSNPRRRLSPSLINRMALMDGPIREAGCRLLIHSPVEISRAEGTVAGYRFGEGALKPTQAGIPRVNGNWTHRTRRLLDLRGMGYHEFCRWTAEEGIRIYVPNSLSELLGDKIATYKLVRGFDEALHPHCEPYRHKARQLGYFVDRGPLTFIKPRGGSKGDRIITINRERDGLLVTRYHHGLKRRIRAAGIPDAVTLIREATTDGRYLIQHGVVTLRRAGSTFDVRVTMVNDGKDWHWLHEARLSPRDSDISNVGQGGDIVATDVLLEDVLGKRAGNALLQRLKATSFALTAYVERLHPGAIPEIAFDFAIDESGSPRLLEINTKPGLAGIGSNVSIYDKEPAHEPLFERWVYPHARHVAEFLIAKARQVM